MKKFRDKLEKRTRDVLRSLKMLGALGRRSNGKLPGCSEKDVERIFNAIKGEVRNARARLQISHNEEFKL